MIERDFDISFISDLALREKQIQQNYRPVIAVHKWFARRPGTLFRGLLLSEFAPVPLKESFYRSHNLRSIHIADPFMGGGTPLLEANRTGCNIVGYDINPMSYWIVREEIEHLDIDTYETEATKLRKFLIEKIGYLYHTQCLKCSSKEAHVKYFLWVKVQNCSKCGEEISLFPGYLISINRRHPNHVFICPTCGNINEVKDRRDPGSCTNCRSVLQLDGPAKRNSCKCPYCGGINSYPLKKEGPPRHRMFAIEYHCKHCKTNHKGRFFKKPDQEDINRFQEAESEWKNLKTCFVPDDPIPQGDETNRLLRWGYSRYCEMFNPRQLLGLELSCQFIAQQTNERVRKALATNLSDLLRYQNMLCRYDTMALKSLDIFSIHGFPVSLVQCESNLLGIPNKKKGLNIGSGGWSNIIDKFIKAKAYCNEPFEIRHRGLKKQTVPIKGEWIGEVKNGSSMGEKRSVELFCMNAAETNLPPSCLDGVFTDPPYFGNVQYAELMDFCYVWLRKLTDKNISAFKFASTRNFDELTANETMGRDMEHFTEGLSLVFQKMAKALKAGSPLVFTYHHNHIEAYYPAAIAILDAGLTCSASLPCPAEMGASIHINGTKSSIIDTVFVCRSTGSVPKRWIVELPSQVANLVREDIKKLWNGNVKPTHGDIRCIIFGHLIRLAIWFLRKEWIKTQETSKRLHRIAQWIDNFGGLIAIQRHLGDVFSTAPSLQSWIIRENGKIYGDYDAAVPF